MGQVPRNWDFLGFMATISESNVNASIIVVYICVNQAK